VRWDVLRVGAAHDASDIKRGWANYIARGRGKAIAE
jgi:hypothetical protein